MLILLSQNEQGISALDLQKHIFPSGSSPMKSTFPWMQRHYVNYYKGEQLVWNKPTWNSLSTPAFPDRRLLLTRKLLNQGILLVKLKSSLRKFYGRQPWLGWPLFNICVTNDHGYVPFVVNTFRSFPHSWLITGFVTRLTPRVPLAEQELFTVCC